MSKLVHWLALIFGAIAVILAAPFALVAVWLSDRADDLQGGWRRGREQNWLWRWARAAKRGAE